MQPCKKDRTINSNIKLTMFFIKSTRTELISTKIWSNYFAFHLHEVIKEEITLP